MSWSSGYMTEIEMQYRYQWELSPANIEMALLLRKYRHRIQRPVRYLQLGYGQGLSLNIHAAACEGDFWGTDVNSVHAANAKDLGIGLNENLHLFADSFEEFAARKDLPEFDIIVMHGIWGWITEQNRNILLDLVHRQLAPGGALIITYSCQSAWAAVAPLRNLIKLHSDLMSAKGLSINAKIDESFIFTQSIIDAGSIFFANNPRVAKYLSTINTQDRRYIAHDFFSEQWEPMAFSDMAKYLTKVKMSYATSARIVDHIDGINLTPEAHKVLEGISNTVFKESVRDLLTSQEVRWDIWLKGTRELTVFEQMEDFKKIPFVLTVPKEEMIFKIRGFLTEAILNPELYLPIVDILSENNHQPCTVDEIAKRLGQKDMSQLIQAIEILIATDKIRPTQNLDVVKKAKLRTDILNQSILQQAPFTNQISFLASPLIGGGIPVSYYEQLILHAMQKGHSNPEDCFNYLSKNILTQEQSVLPNSIKNVELFFARKLPLLKRLGIADNLVP